MIESTLAVPMKGLGVLFQVTRYSSMAATNWETLIGWQQSKEGRMPFPVGFPNHRSIKFSQLELVGTK